MSEKRIIEEMLGTPAPPVKRDASCEKMMTIGDFAERLEPHNSLYDRLVALVEAARATDCPASNLAKRCTTSKYDNKVFVHFRSVNIGATRSVWNYLLLEEWEWKHFDRIYVSGREKFDFYGHEDCPLDWDNMSNKVHRDPAVIEIMMKRVVDDHIHEMYDGEHFKTDEAWRDEGKLHWRTDH